MYCKIWCEDKLYRGCYVLYFFVLSVICVIYMKFVYNFFIFIIKYDYKFFYCYCLMIMFWLWYRVSRICYMFLFYGSCYVVVIWVIVKDNKVYL